MAIWLSDIFEMVMSSFSTDNPVYTESVWWVLESKSLLVKLSDLMNVCVLHSMLTSMETKWTSTFRKLYKHEAKHFTWWEWLKILSHQKVDNQLLLWCKIFWLLLSSSHQEIYFWKENNLPKYCHGFVTLTN